MLKVRKLYTLRINGDGSFAPEKAKATARFTKMKAALKTLEENLAILKDSKNVWNDEKSAQYIKTLEDLVAKLKPLVEKEAEFNQYYTQLGGFYKVWQA